MRVVRKTGHIRLGSGDSPTGRYFEGLSVMCTAVAQFSPSVADRSVCLSCAPLWYSSHHWWMTDLCVCHVNICNIVPTLSGSPTPPIFHPGFDGLKLGPQRNLPFSSVSFDKNLVRAVR